MRRLALTLLLVTSLTLTPTSVFAVVDSSDDFEDGVIDTDLWVFGGRRESWTPSDEGTWTWSHNEITAADGYLQTRVYGPASGYSYGATAWIRSTYNFNDGRSHIINFTWNADVAPQPQAGSLYYIQLTNGYMPSFEEKPLNHFLTDGLEGTTDLLYTPNPLGEEYHGKQINSDTPKETWSLAIDSSGVTRLYNGPNGTGSLVREESPDSTEPWYVRFVVSEATSSGYGAGDSRFNLYRFSSTVVCPCDSFTTSDFGPPMGKKKKLGSTLPVKFQLFYDDPDDDPDAGPVEVAGQDQLNVILGACGPACQKIKLYDVSVAAEQVGLELPADGDNVGEGGDLGNCFRYTDGNWIYNLRLEDPLFKKGGTYLVEVEIGQCTLRPGNGGENSVFQIDPK